MLNASRSTPSGTRDKEDDVQFVRSSAKKLKQGRLPFKIIGAEFSSRSSKTSPVVLADNERSNENAVHEPEGTEETRKRKLSRSSESDKERSDENAVHTPPEGTKEARKRKLSRSSDSEELIEQSQKSTSKGNLLTTTAAAKKKKTTEENDNDSAIIELSDDEEGDASEADHVANVANDPETPKLSKSTVVVLGKGAGTPKSGSMTSRISAGDSVSKIQIKLPKSSGKNKKKKRRKSLQKSATGDYACDDEPLVESSDDNDKLGKELHPEKKPKLDSAKNSEKELETISLSSDDASNKHCSEVNDSICDSSTESNGRNGESAMKVRVRVGGSKQEEASSPTSPEAIELPEKTDVEADDEDDDKESTLNSTSSSDAADTTEQRNDQSLDSKVPNAALNLVPKMNLTPKQIRLMDQRRKAREEKERKLQEDKMQKQREKEDKDLARKRDREEREEYRRKEREEKDEHKRKEREERERKRLEEIESRNEEKRKRNEAKEEEMRKKEEERKRKEHEKEEAENKKKKAAEAFTKFFVPKSTRKSIKAEDTHATKCDGVADPQAFRPFQVKGDMKLAPICRKTISASARRALDAVLETDTADDDRKKSLPKSALYVSDLKAGKITPHKWTVAETKCCDNFDVQIVDTELENVGQAIVEETHGPLERYRAKFYKFHENRRPPFFGTWRKRTQLITARRPFAQDKKYFDYEVDSDLEWEDEDEEPGESLDGSDDDKEKESEDDDYEVDNEWFVPHGHLSDEELQHEDDNDVGREAQKAKLKLLQIEFAQEMKKTTKKLKPRLIGCIWADADGNKPELCPQLIWNTLTVHEMICAEAPLLKEPETSERLESTSPTTSSDKLKRIILSTEMLKDLIRLVHGNSNSKAFLIKEFIAHIEATEEAIRNGSVRGPLKSAVREKIDEYAEWQILELDSVSGSARKKNKTKKQLCWIVSDDVLQQMELQDVSLPNTWQYNLQPKTRPSVVSETDPKPDGDGTTDAETSIIIADDNSERPKASGVVAKLQRPKPTTTHATTELLSFATQANRLRLETEREVAQMQDAHGSKQSSPAIATAASKNTENASQTAQPTTANNKKRVPLLMSLARGQQISQPAKNALISQYLRTKNDSKQKAEDRVASPLTTSDVVIMLD